MADLFDSTPTDTPKGPRPLADRLRPAKLSEVIGQQQVLGPDAPLGTMLSSGSLSSLIFWGPPGVGKTTIARLLADETDLHFVQISAIFTGVPDLRKVFEAAKMRRQNGKGTLLFVDEIHRLSPVVEEVLYPAMEDYQLDIMIGEGPAARSIKLDLPPFTLVGATTRAGLLTSPLRDRFGIVQRLEFYNREELTTIVERSARILGMPIDHAGAAEIARRSRGTPRIANRLLRRVRDYADVKADGQVSQAVADKALDMLNVDAEGFDHMDRRVLLAMIEKFDGGPVGVDSLAAAISEERDTIEDVIEPYLIQQGYMVRTPRGRMVTRNAYAHFGLDGKQAGGGDSLSLKLDE